MFDQIITYVSGNKTFKYDGQPHTIKLQCVENPDVEIVAIDEQNNLLSETECGSYTATVVVRDKGYTIDYDKCSTYVTMVIQP